MGPCYDTATQIALGLDPRVRAAEPAADRTPAYRAPPRDLWKLLLRWITQPRTVTESPGTTRPPSVTRA